MSEIVRALKQITDALEVTAEEYNVDLEGYAVKLSDDKLVIEYRKGFYKEDDEDDVPSV